MWVTSSLTTVLTPTAVALGNFDGVHRGHQQVVRPVLQSAAIETGRRASLQGEQREIFTDNATEGNQILSQAETTGRPYPTVVSFYPHPQEFFTGQPRALLTPPKEKAIELGNLGVEQLVLLPFDRELADLTPQQFVEEILVRRLKSQRISVGQDFRFGCKRTGTATDLQAIAATYGIETTIVGLQICSGERISSSFIRTALTEGDISRANQLLGRSYTLTGTVVQGQQLGRTIGFPTANLHLPSEKFLPRYGVYAVQVKIENGERSSEPGNIIPSPIPGVMNIGCRPTVNGTAPTVEVYLIDWAGDLYGQTLTVSLEQFLRPEQKFASLDELKAQIQADCDKARSVLK
ncbi:bifunctional riboflavin kinase/FAD synthetase [Microseira wollei]|uniref:Riboflavin biosynthesis protein n=1 Tax=Microseira wollei NIES-4236 TaxID=2530354 RepID=A0AAV3XNQ0_9CYAN|nr:bifunctional riboflavin kinase/FAD synthetase [Microseira wollei]GET42431.1 riboflavin biosynthesis protein RibF [Microseira wollei NIES-4236]